MAEILTEQIDALREKQRKMEAPSEASTKDQDTTPKQLPKGVVLGKDGKPCRSCTSVASWLAMAKKNPSAQSPNSSTPSTPNSTSTSLSTSLPRDCPPDVEQLGRGSWRLLHSIAATYPEKATHTQQNEMRQFLLYFSKFYPCWTCGEGFNSWMTKKGHEPRVEGRDTLGQWMCEAHNVVNRRLGKPEFDCSKVDERWRTGWKDGRCD
ncbi:MAG: hypothetical protein M1834_007970 [Cirrosporium novae-zelandiae]|nr:MAG: hypothetical protein M1834_007970 [Cirrosporium novae-zelandiae]